VQEASALFFDRRPLDLPFPEGVFDAFAREVADVHRELYGEQSELYGENVAAKIERCRSRWRTTSGTHRSVTPASRNCMH